MRGKASVCHMVLHLIAEGESYYKDTDRKNDWMIWHDALSILWEKVTMAWLKSLKCPHPGWQERTWMDRIIHLRGEWAKKVHNRYKGKLPGDSPEQMPLDCHLFSDVKEGTGRNVALSYLLSDDNPLKYKMNTPNETWKSICRTIENNAPPSHRIVKDVENVLGKYLDAIITAKGAYIDEKNIRHGYRLVAEQEQRRREARNPLSNVDKNLLTEFHSACKVKLSENDITTMASTVVIESVEVIDVVDVDDFEEDEEEDDSREEGVVVDGEEADGDVVVVGEVNDEDYFSDNDIEDDEF